MIDWNPIKEFLLHPWTVDVIFGGIESSLLITSRPIYTRHTFPSHLFTGVNQAETEGDSPSSSEHSIDAVESSELDSDCRAPTTWKIEEDSSQDLLLAPGFENESVQDEDEGIVLEAQKEELLGQQVPENEPEIAIEAENDNQENQDPIRIESTTAIPSADNHENNQSDDSDSEGVPLQRAAACFDLGGLVVGESSNKSSASACLSDYNTSPRASVTDNIFNTCKQNVEELEDAKFLTCPESQTKSNKTNTSAGHGWHWLDETKIVWEMKEDGTPVRMGEGAFCVALKATYLNRQVLIKVSRPTSTKDSGDIYQEADIATRMGQLGVGPEVVGVFKKTRFSPGFPAIAWELIPECTDLHHFLGHGRYTLHPYEICDIVKQTVWLVSKMHEQGFIHNDIKLDNVLVFPRRPTDTMDMKYKILLIDFGETSYLTGNHYSSISEEERITLFRQLAPEVCNGIETSENTDAYSLGFLMHQVISVCKDKFVRKMYSPLARHCLHEDPKVRARVSVNYLAKVLVKEPTAVYVKRVTEEHSVTVNNGQDDADETITV